MQGLVMALHVVMFDALCACMYGLPIVNSNEDVLSGLLQLSKSILQG